MHVIWFFIYDVFLELGSVCKLKDIGFSNRDTYILYMCLIYKYMLFLFIIGDW